MSVIFGSARNGENGASGNAAGDQSGAEVSTQTFYVHSKGWYGFAPKSADVGAKLAEAMQQACDNNNIGYDQNDRDSLLTQYKKYGSIKAITTKCECDCSSLVRVCIYQATGKLLSDFTTASEPDVLASSGLFESKRTVTIASECTLGMVLCTRSKGHTGIICSGAPNTGSTTSSGTHTGSVTSGTTAESYDASIAGKYTVTASSLNIRSGAGTSYNVLTTAPRGATVQNYGYYSTVDGVKWLYVQISNVTGFASSEWLTKAASSSSSSTPTYTKGKTYTVKVDHLAVRTGPGASYDKKAKSQLTSNGKVNAYDDGCLKKNTRVTCQATRTNSGEVWMEIPSGWVAAYYDGKKYIS